MNRRNRAANRSMFASWHSQTVATDQPARRNADFTRPSRSRFASSFPRQNVLRDLGVRANGQLACRCQKQP